MSAVYREITLYRATRWLCAAMLVGYVVVATGIKHPGQSEIFPFFNWSLFSETSDLRKDISLIIKSVNEEALVPPKNYYDMKQTFAIARSKNPVLAKLLNKWASAIRRGDSAAADRLRAVVEKTYMREVTTAQYDLAVVHYNPIRRLREGAIEKIVVIESFEKTGQ